MLHHVLIYHTKSYFNTIDQEIFIVKIFSLVRQKNKCTKNLNTLHCRMVNDEIFKCENLNHKLFLPHKFPDLWFSCVYCYTDNFSLEQSRRQNGQEGFVPANYVREIEPTKVKKVTKVKEVVNVPVKVKRKKVEKRSAIIVKRS